MNHFEVERSWRRKDFGRTPVGFKGFFSVVNKISCLLEEVNSLRSLVGVNLLVGEIIEDSVIIRLAGESTLF